ncbi:hypothetical protein D3C78_1093190 [compost metagenome]
MHRPKLSLPEAMAEACSRRPTRSTGIIRSGSSNTLGLKSASNSMRSGFKPEALATSPKLVRQAARTSDVIAVNYLA